MKVFVLDHNFSGIYLTLEIHAHPQTIYAVQPLHLHKVRHWNTLQKIFSHSEPNKTTTQASAERRGRMYSCAGNRINFTLQQILKKFLGSCVTVVLLLELPQHVCKSVYFTTFSLFRWCKKQPPPMPGSQHWLALQGNLAHDECLQSSWRFPPLPK